MPTLAVDQRARAVISPELAAFADRLNDPVTREEYRAVQEAVDAGQVSGPPLDKLQAFLELCLTTGRVRQRQGLHAEDALKRVFERTPRGAALAGSAGDVTRALAPLVGQAIKELQLTLVRPGTYRLVLETEQYRISIGLAPAGAHVESLEVGL